MTARIMPIPAFFRVSSLVLPAFLVWSICLVWCTAACADRRVALVIGNSDYGPQEQRLLNPRNDAGDMAEALKSLGFQVILRVDADRQRFLQSLAEFSRAVSDADIGLFFYAGHGMQFNGANYLIPVGAALQDEISVRYELVAMDEVQRALERSAGARILILDACRNNPFAAELARSMRTASRDISPSRGLARIAQSYGSVVAYATQANDVAADGTDRNSPFTGALLATLREPGLEIGPMFRKVANLVYEATKGKQVPELSMSLLTDVYLNRAETDAQVWARVRAAAGPDGLRDFLARYPDSFYAADARVRLDMLDREARAREVDRERAEQDKQLRDRLAALEVERLQAEMNARAAAHAAQDAAERLRQEQAERERLAAEVTVRQRAIAEATEQLRAETAGRSRQSAEATDRERELRARLGDLEQAGRKAAADLAERARASAADTAARDQQMAVMERARREAEAQVAALAQQAKTLTSETGPPAVSPAVGREPPGQQQAALIPEKPPTFDEGQLVLAVKTELKRLGCYFEAVDSNAKTPALRKAIVDFAARTHLAKVPDGPAPQLLEDLKARSGRICPLVCGPREQESNGRCVARTCAAGEVFDRAGRCVPKPDVATAAPHPHRNDAPAARPPGRGGCFTFNGRQFCE